MRTIVPQRHIAEPASNERAPAASAQSRSANAGVAARHAPADSPRQLQQATKLAQLQPSDATVATRADGLPAGLRHGIETLSGIDMSGVRVHRNSSKPAALQAHAYAQGQDIHLGPGQEKHLPHEAWHVVQQAQGRVRPTVQMKAGVAVNDDAGLEREADRMGGCATKLAASTRNRPTPCLDANASTRPGSVRQLRLPPGSAIEEHLKNQGATMENTRKTVRRLLPREAMDDSKRASNVDPEDVLDKVFRDGAFDKAAYETLLTEDNQHPGITSIEGIHDADFVSLAPALARAAELAIACAERTDWIKQVFGDDQSTVEKVQGVYRSVGVRLSNFGQENIKVDYSGANEQMGKAGASSAGSACIELSKAQLSQSEGELAILLVHEGCHEHDAEIVDHVYYGGAGFLKASKEKRITNAAHYEEVLRRCISMSNYLDMTFGPSAEQSQEKKGSSGGEKTRNPLAPAQNGLRGLWERTGQLHDALRSDAIGKNRIADRSFVRAIKAAYALPMLEINGELKISALDLALMESIARVFNLAMDKVKRLRKEEVVNEGDAEEKWPLLAALKAIEKVGGFAGEDPHNNLQTINRIRKEIGQAGYGGDPAPMFGAIQTD